MFVIAVVVSPKKEGNCKSNECNYGLFAIILAEKHKKQKKGNRKFCEITQINLIIFFPEKKRKRTVFRVVFARY